MTHKAAAAQLHADISLAELWRGSGGPLDVGQVRSVISIDSDMVDVIRDHS